MRSHCFKIAVGAVLAVAAVCLLPVTAMAQTAAPVNCVPAMMALMPQLLQWAPFAGLLLVAFVMHYRLKQLETLQQKEFEKAHRKESMLLARERYVLVSTLEGELTENKNRIEAFLTIYGDMLRNMKHPEGAPEYQKAGDIVQKHPSLSKTVFEANVSKLSLLDMKLAGQLSKFYASIPKEQEYINIEASVPVETAIKLIEKILKEAEDILAPLHQIITALDEVVSKKAV